ncbi:MAG: DUF1287 domain-containing protein [Clostridiaceae bacterium]|nr:DUF1287 domain-containing protein [Clostridiaceae bacterium]
MKIVRKILVVGWIIILMTVTIIVGIIFYEKKKKVYYAKDFGITVIKSQKDYDNDQIDDYTDILLGAREDAKNAPKYKNAYYAGGYPPYNEGVCTDVIWRAFKNAGYNLKDMVDEDIKNNVDKYPRVEDKPDSNIDFRRVGNLKTFFERNATNLTIDLTKIEEWQPGDIVTFGISHIGIISDKRNKKGIPYLIHNGGQPLREEDALELNNKFEKISGHFRY